MPQRWAAVRLRLTCVVGGFEFEAVQATMTFEMNSIPTAVVSIAVGREVRTLQPATSHSKIGMIQPRDSFKLYLVPQALGGEGGAPGEWHEAMIFDGIVVGVGWQRSTSGANFTIYAQHWLADLHYSSTLSGASHPGNPADFTYAAGYRSPHVMTAGASTDVDWVPHVPIGGTGVNIGDLTDDLWENVLKKWMVQLSEQDPIDNRLNDDVANEAALDALEKMTSEHMGMRLSERGGAHAIGNAVCMALSQAVSRADWNTTLWGKLVGEWSPQYWFAVIPRVEDALIVPFTGALRGEQWADIKTGDYVHCDLHSGMAQILRAVGITFPLAFAAGGNTNPGEHGAMTRGLGGLWPAGSDKKGLVLIKDAPLWLTDAMQGYKYGGRSCGVLPLSVPIRTSQTDEDVGPEQDPPNNPEDNQEDWKTVLDDYAHQWYMIEMLKGRQGEISGRLRFDIAPGSQVRIEGGRDPFIAGDAMGVPFFASVTRVTNLINAEIQRVGTSFSLAHIRNEKENESDETSVEKPPLYKEGWVGKELVEGYLPNV